MRLHFPLHIAALASLFLAACVPLSEAMDSSPEFTVDQALSTADALTENDTGPKEFPIAVTYFTPAQTEGPFYPVSKPADRDNDLAALEGAGGRPAGEVLEFGGRLYEGSGMPVQGAVIEIWQTDDNGVYPHAGDPGYSRRDVNFQSYGEAVTEEDGSYSFRTIMPGHYEPRPRHIHVKVRLGERELLTTQFYFSNDPQLASDRIFAGASVGEKALIMEVVEGLDAEGNRVLIGKRDIVLRAQLSE